MKTWLFNPFKFIAGGKALLFGLAAIFITAALCLKEDIHLDGVIDVHTGELTPYWHYIIEPFIDLVCFIIPLYIFGRIYSTSEIRFVDIAGTSALARYPMFFAVLVTMLMPNITSDPRKLISDILSNPVLMLKIASLGLLTLPFIIWTVALMYNAYSLSTNLKGPKAVWTFVASILIAEVVSKVIFNCLL